MNDIISSFRADVRGVLGDNVEPLRHTEAQIDRAVVDAFRRMFSVRPESRYVNGVLKTFDFPSADSDLETFQVSFDPRWRMGIVYFAAARRYESDVVDAVNRELAASYFKQADAVFAS